MVDEYLAGNKNLKMKFNGFSEFHIAVDYIFGVHS